jgi:hypothetical protein
VKKKLAVLLAAAMLTLGAAANAMAYFADGDLIRVAYVRGGTTEVATDMGSISSLLAAGSTTINGTSGLSLTDLGAASWSDVYVAFFAKTGTTVATRTAYVSGDTATTNNTNWSLFATPIGNMYTGYQSVGGTTNQTVIQQQSDALSYATKMNNNDATGVSNGRMGGFITTIGAVELNLAALATGGTATATIYSKGPGITGGTMNATNLTITMDNTGSATVINTAATPIPPSFLLMGSGLLGMVGIRRRMAA